MSKVLMESLKMDLPALADMIRSKGRKGDSILAHISPKEAALLKRRGGSGTINPDTGLPEFAEDGGFDVGTYFGGETGGAFTPAAGAPADTFQAPPTDIGATYTPTYAAPAFDQTTQPGYGAALKPGAAQIPAQTTAAFMQGEPGQLAPASLAATPVEQVNIPGGGGNAAPGYFANAVSQLTQPTNLARLGLATGLGIFGAGQARKSAGQIQAAQGQQQAIAQPYQTQGQQLVQQAQAGQLSPASTQAYQAAQARINQGIAARGGVGVQQAANEMGQLYQQLLNNQYTYGLNVMQVGDNISLGAIKTGLQLDTQLNQITNQFYTNLAQMVGGGSPGGTTIRVG